MHHYEDKDGHLELPNWHGHIRLEPGQWWLPQDGPPPLMYPTRQAILDQELKLRMQKVKAERRRRRSEAVKRVKGVGRRLLDAIDFE